LIPPLPSTTRAAIAFALTLGATTAAPGPVGAAQRPDAPAASRTRLLDLPGVRRLFNELARQRSSASEGERASAWMELNLLAYAVAGDEAQWWTPAAPVGTGTAAIAAEVTLVVTAEVAARDAAAYKLLGVGYSPRETADIVSGRISQRALDTARRMVMAGLGTESAANYLDGEYSRAAAARAAPPPPIETGGEPTRFDPAISEYSALHGVDPALVRAVILVESAFDPFARSRAGAIGLMQLMPATARELGVDPLQPEQNIEGGARYLSEMIKMFGGIELALVAYNAGPGFTRRYARGQTALYGETRAYVKKVLSRLAR
jgi:soluble lytic murein transglycosylase-like protein